MFKKDNKNVLLITKNTAISVEEHIDLKRKLQQLGYGVADVRIAPNSALREDVQITVLP